MSVEANKRVIQRFTTECINTASETVAAELIAPDSVPCGKGCHAADDSSSKQVRFFDLFNFFEPRSPETKYI